MRLFRKRETEADYEVICDRRGRYWFVMYDDATGDRLCQAPPPGYASYEEAEAAAQRVVDISSADEVTFTDRRRTA